MSHFRPPPLENLKQVSSIPKTTAGLKNIVLPSEIRSDDNRTQSSTLINLKKMTTRGPN